MKRFIALVLSLVMALSLCAPAWAAGEVVVADTAEVAQAALDAATNGTTIQLKADVNYGTLYIRPVVDNANTTTGHNYFTGNYQNEYLRTVEDVTIVGASGATIDAIEIDSSYSTTTGAGALHLVDIKNLTFDGVTFTDAITTSNYGVFAPILVDLQWARVDGLTVKDCKLTSDQSNNLALVYIVAEQATGSTFETCAKNVTISGNTVDGIRSLCELRETENVTITGNTVSNTTKNSIQMSTNSGKTYSGNVNITGNTADGIRGRFVRMAGADDATVVIEDNTITNYLGEDADYIKVTKVDNTNITEQVASNNVLGYTVSFDANGGKGVLTQEPIPAGQFTLPTEHPFTREGYTFKGWATDKNATKVLGATYNVTGDVTFYAIWEEEECTSDSHVDVVVTYSGDKATKVYCDYCGMTFAFIQGTEDDAKDKFGEGNYVNAENDVWYTLKAQSGEVPSVPEIPPVEDDKTEGKEVAVTTPAEVDTVVNDTVIDAVKNSAETTVTVTTPVEGDTSAKTTIKFNDADAKNDFATATDIITALTAVEAPVTDEVTAKVEEKVSDDAELAAYLDIDITVFADGDPVGEITQLPKEIKVVIPASALNFGDLEKNHTRKVSVIRFHDDQVDVIPAKLEANGSVSFYSHLFSTYAVVYEDVATSTNYPIYYWPVGDTTTTDEDIKSPETFDAGVALYVGMSVAAAVGTVTLSKKRED